MWFSPSLGKSVASPINLFGCLPVVLGISQVWLASRGWLNHQCQPTNFRPKSRTTSIGMDFEGAPWSPESSNASLQVALLSTLVPALSTESSRRFVNALAPEASEEAKEVGSWERVLRDWWGNQRIANSIRMFCLFSGWWLDNIFFCWKGASQSNELCKRISDWKMKGLSGLKNDDRCGSPEFFFENFSKRV